MSNRPHMPLYVKLTAAILQLGLDPASVDFDHDPALGLRERTADGGYIPDANDPKYIRLLDRHTDHKRKTFGTKATTAGSDIHTMAKGRRLRAVDREYKAAIATKDEPRERRTGPRIRSRNELRIRYPCGNCRKRFRTLSELAEHVARRHAHLLEVARE